MAAAAIEARSARRSGAGAAVAGATAGLVLAVVLYRFPPPLVLAVAAGVALVAVLALALARYDAAAALGFGLLGIVVVEPAPADGVFFVLMAIAVVCRRFRLWAAPVPVVTTLGVFLVLNVLSAVQVEDLGRAGMYFTITVFVAAVGIWTAGYVVSAARARLVVRSYLFAAVASALAGILALFAPLPGAELLTEGGRARGLFQDPNVFGPFLIPALLIVVEEIVEPRLLRSRLATKILWAAILAVGVLFCYSRGAWLNLGLGFVAMGAVLALRPGGGRRALAFALVVGVAALAAIGTVLATGSSDFLTERARPQTYDTQRFSGQRAGLQPAWDYPFGAGPGQFEAVADISAHSTYARALGEQGFPGLIALLVLLGFTLALAVRNCAAGRGTYGIGSAALLGAWCGLLANSFFIDTLHWRHLWIVAALIWAGAMRRSPGRIGGGRGAARRVG